MKIGVVGAGSWGTALANMLSRNGHGVRLWAYEAEVVKSVNELNENEIFLPGCPLDPELTATVDVAEAVSDAELVVSAAPSHVVRPVIKQVAMSINADAGVVSVSKGLEEDSYLRMTEVIQSEVRGARVAALSGPSFAKEVYETRPTAVVVASRDESFAMAVRDAFASSRFRVYTSRDVTGVEHGGSLKNVMAIAAGIVDGLDLGYNPRAALITRGLAEITRLAVARGAESGTMAGLAGLGDLILTCTGPLSRNRSLGVELAGGLTLEAAIGARKTVAEGVNTARVVSALARKMGVDMPITTQVYEILFGGKNPRAALEDLMERELTTEH